LKACRPKLEQRQCNRCLGTTIHKIIGKTNFSTYNSEDKREGLFSLPNLHKPADFLSLASNAMSDCNSLREILRNALETDQSMSPKETLFLLDDISNTVCSVIDASELCRSVHASPEWRHAAGQAFQLLSEYIAELNADVNLYRSLVPITSDPTVMMGLEEEERRMAVMLKKEFERDGIHLKDEERKEVQQLSGFVVQLETLFSENLQRHSVYEVEGDLSHEVTKTIPIHAFEQVVSQQNASPNSVILSTEPLIANSLLKYSSSAALRKEVYYNTNTCCPQNLEVLDALISQRHALSTKIGYESYAHYFLTDKMAQSPQNVRAFLGNVQSKCEGQFKDDLATLKHVKQQMEENSDPIEAWDLSYYTGLVKTHLHGDIGESDSATLSGHFTVENCLEGMKVLVQRLFGIVMEEADLTAGEQWVNTDRHPGSDGVNDSSKKMSMGKIQKFVFYEEEGERPLGTMYLDLHPREGKYTHAAHFTVRCGCKIRNKMADSDSHDATEHQLPIVALVCNLSSPNSNIGSSSSAILSHPEVETLFHEFGHAMHSLLSRTSFQHLSGTRAAMDFVETPSHLMEQYVWNEEFLNIIGSHHATGHSPPTKAIQNLVNSRNIFRAMEVQTQVVYALFDQTIFNKPDLWRRPCAGSNTTTTTDVFAMLHRENGVPYVDGTHWHTRFGHLVTYGAGYYSYLNASIYSADLWNSNFAENAFCRKAGMAYWKQMLIHGGSKDPNLMLKALLGRDPKVDSFFQSLE